MKKHLYLILLSIFLLSTLVVVQTIRATTIPETSTDSSKYFDVAGKELSSTEAEKVQKLLSSIKKTEKFVVYANKIDRTNHIEGNVFVNEVATSSNLVITRVSEKQNGDFSYIGKSSSPIQLSDGEKIILGPQIDISKPNDNQTIINGGYSNNINVVQLSADEVLEKENSIKSILNEISQAGESAKCNIDTSFYDNSKDSFESVNNMLTSGIVTSGSVISINVDYKQLLNNEGAFGNLINNNQGTRIIVNVIFTDSTPNDINIMKAFRSDTKVNTDFNSLSPYILWNFGNYSGNITISEEMLGVIIAPRATVYQAAGNLNGQIIADVAGNNGELHQVTVTPDIPPIPDVPKEPDNPKPTETTEETSVPDEPKPTETTENTSVPDEPVPTETTEETSVPDEPVPTETTEETSVPDEPVPTETPKNPVEPVTPPSTSNEPQKPVVLNSPTIPEETTETEVPEEPVSPKIPTNNTKKTTPKTGDTSNVYLYLVFLIVDLGFIICAIIYYKKKK